MAVCGSHPCGAGRKYYTLYLCILLLKQQQQHLEPSALTDKKPFFPTILAFSNFVSVLHVQVVEETQVILREYGFRFVRRGPIFVKGKGELLTFFLKGRDRPAAFPNGSSVTLPHQVVDNP